MRRACVPHKSGNEENGMTQMTLKSKWQDLMKRNERRVEPEWLGVAGWDEVTEKDALNQGSH